MKTDESLAKFEELFDPEVKEGLFLVRSNMGKGSTAFKGSSYNLTGTRFLAWVDCETDELHSHTGGLRFMYRPGLFSNRQDFKGTGIYRVKFRVNKTRPTDNLIVKILGKASDSRLDAILDEYNKPVVITNDLGTFKLDRRYDSYEGMISYQGRQIPVRLNVREGTTDAQMQFERLKRICAGLEHFETMVRQYISEDESLWDWVDESEGSHIGFEQKLDGPSLVIDENNETEVWFDGGEPFGYHSIIVYVDEKNTCTGINMAG